MKIVERLSESDEKEEDFVFLPKMPRFVTFIIAHGSNANAFFNAFIEIDRRISYSKPSQSKSKSLLSMVRAFVSLLSYQRFNTE